jgi:hypothetical protein
MKDDIVMPYVEDRERTLVELNASFFKGVLK